MVRSWTLAEAEAALPQVERLLATALAGFREIREMQEHIEDLRIVWGERVLDPGCPDHAEFKARLAAVQEKRDDFEAALLAFEALGCEVKDLEQGLVDFRGRLGDQDVYLCWRKGEPGIRYWHTLESGFRGRRLIPGLSPR